MLEKLITTSLLALTKANNLTLSIADNNGQLKIEKETVTSNFKKAIPAEIKTALVSLQVKDNWHGILYIGIDWLFIICAIIGAILTDMHPLIYGAAIIVIASRQRGLMNLVHFASHKSLFKNKAMNNWVCRIFAAFPVMISLSSYTTSHSIHHSFLWNKQKDPKRIYLESLGLNSPLNNAPEFWKLHILRPILLWHTPKNIFSAFCRQNEPGYEVLTRILFWTFVLSTIILFGKVAEFFFFWIVPFCTVFQIIRYWSDIADHAGLESDNPWIATRSWSSYFLENWILAPHASNYHLAHHLFPSIPHYRLAAAHCLLMQVPQYASGHHCKGFFWGYRADAPSVIQDIQRPQDIHKFIQLTTSTHEC